MCPICDKVVSQCRCMEDKTIEYKKCFSCMANEKSNFYFKKIETEPQIKQDGTTEVRIPKQEGVIWKYEIKSSYGDSSGVRYAALGKDVAVKISSFLYDWHYSFKWEGAYINQENVVYTIARDLILNHFDDIKIFAPSNESAIEIFTIEGESGDRELENDIAFAVNGKQLVLAVDSFIKAFNEEFDDKKLNDFRGEDVYDKVQEMIAEHFDKVHSIVQLVQ